MEILDPDDIAKLSDDLNTVRSLLFGAGTASKPPRWGGRIITHFETDDDEDETVEEIEEVPPCLNSRPASLGTSAERKPSGPPFTAVDYQSQITAMTERAVASGISSTEVSQFLINLGLRLQARHLADWDGLTG